MASASVTPHDRRRRLQTDAECAALVDGGALGGDAADDVRGGQYRGAICRERADLVLSTGSADAFAPIAAVRRSDRRVQRPSKYALGDLR
jgi:hypothetical protein